MFSQERRHFLKRYRPVDIAFKVVGTGSVGTRDYVILSFGNGNEDPLFLQMNEEPPSAYAQYLKAQIPGNQGERVVQGQRLQAQSDIFLGWTRMDGRDYPVRQLADHKGHHPYRRSQGRRFERIRQDVRRGLWQGTRALW
jgi:uncharacterized protein (DUF2252 family)